MEPNNIKDNYAVCVKKGSSTFNARKGRFAKINPDTLDLRSMEAWVILARRSIVLRS